MVYEDLDAGDETHRNGDTIKLPHPDGEGTDLDSVGIARGVPVTYDGTDIAAAGSSSSNIVGILANYDVYGDTGKEKVGAEATIRTSGTVKADLSGIVDLTGSEGGTVHGNNGELLIVETLDADNDIAEVLMR